MTKVKRLSKENFLKIVIKNKLKEEDIAIVVKTITRILKNVGIRRQARSKKETIPKFDHPAIKRTRGMISKVNRLVYRKTMNVIGISKKKQTF